MCELLHYFCDCELRHRIEAIVSFSDSFVSKLQYNQKFRYNELMQALNMSAAVTAKKTKEFRSPPQEQVTAPSSNIENCLRPSLRRVFVLWRLFDSRNKTPVWSFEPSGWKEKSLKLCFWHCLSTMSFWQLFNILWTRTALILYFHFQYNTGISSLNINWYRYKSDISTLQMMHTFISWLVL